MSRSIGLVAVLLTSLAWNTAQAQANKLNLFIWSEYLDPSVVAEFEKKFDCKVTVDLYEDEAGMQAKLQGGGKALYDVVVPPDQTIPGLIKLKLLAPLRLENLPNLKNLEDRFINPPYDPGNKYSVAFQWGTVGLYVRKPKDIKLDPSWGILFDPAQQIGPFVLMDTARETIGAALKYKGYSLNSTDPAQLKEARELVLAAKRRSQGFENGVGGKNKVLAKGTMAAIVYNGDAVRGMSEDEETVFFVPREGGEIWVDNLAVPAKAPHRDMAEKFINFLLEPETAVKVAKFSQYASPNKAAKPLLGEEDLKNPAIYPPAEVMQKLEFLQDLGRKTRLYDEIWTQIKSK
ncbi:MAG TPA: spermidine/putrescine ABC transporter substrate-binding protein [Candidatus Paceibacterota bacterium]|nr:spermidine/putrescine ABC transporter substrate-binding protein [Verrucomicrobiota bacterium]HRY48930.1 spermidine/putrescine ABC transporter substrate-binding protein [Candidatus Paceibacterota bacterium]HRZ99142.1 spermidine/putrescine ABC transporter substrate-binding protein [Candidatus Paceibacterota bacterium]